MAGERTGMGWRVCAVVAAFCAATGATQGQTGFLATVPADNGSGGVFMELTPVKNALAVTSFDLWLAGDAGTSVRVEVWVRDGGYEGFDNDPSGWTLSQTAAATRSGPNHPTPLELAVPIELELGETVSVYLHAIEHPGDEGIRYAGSDPSPPPVEWGNSYLAMFSDTARVGADPFGGDRFSPRTFAGAVHYDIQGPIICDADSFFAYLTAFAAGDLSADCNGNGVVDAFDFFEFLNDFPNSCCGF